MSEEALAVLIVVGGLFDCIFAGCFYAIVFQENDKLKIKSEFLKFAISFLALPIFFALMIVAVRTLVMVMIGLGVV